MTNVEAAHILDNLAWLGTRDEQDKVEAAIRIAVEELRSGGEKGMSDLIRRQAVLDLIAGWTYDLCYKEDEWRAAEEIENLPSAQLSVPETNVGDIISRQAAIEAIKRAIWDKYTVKDAIDAVCNVPSAQERKKGRWVSTDDGWDGEYFVCSKCGCPWTLIEGSPEENGMNFCPNCGADIRGD